RGWRMLLVVEWAWRPLRGPYAQLRKGPLLRRRSDHFCAGRRRPEPRTEARSPHGPTRRYRSLGSRGTGGMHLHRGSSLAPSALILVEGYGVAVAQDLGLRRPLLVFH